MRDRRSFHVAVPCALAAAWASDAWADPQASLGLTAGAVVQDVAGSAGPNTTLHVGGRGDVLFLRNSHADMGLGPYADVATAGLRDVDLGGGLEWLVPLSENVPVVLSGGGFVRNGNDGVARSWAPGVDGSVFVGSRSYNFHSWYGLAAGVFAEVRCIPGPASSTDVVMGLQLDLELLALPVLLAWGALTHSS